MAQAVRRFVVSIIPVVAQGETLIYGLLRSESPVGSCAAPVACNMCVLC